MRKKSSTDRRRVRIQMRNPATTLSLTIGDKSRQLNKIETTDTVVRL
jgi:hypothetical protein